MNLVGLSAIEDLYATYADCTNCGLCERRSRVVFGSGSTSADIFIIGEFPGVDEDAAGMPFVGRPGRLLMDLLASAWPKTDELEAIKRIPPLVGRDDPNGPYFEALRDYLDRYIFWTNATCCFSGEAGRSATHTEIEACKDRLMRTIYAVDPMIILTLGKTAASAVLGKNVQITTQRGTLFDTRIPSPLSRDVVRYPMMALYSPSHLLRKGDQTLVTKKQGDTYATLRDITYVLTLLGQHYKDAYGTTFPDRPDTFTK